MFATKSKNLPVISLPDPPSLLYSFLPRIFLPHTLGQPLWNTLSWAWSDPLLCVLHPSFWVGSILTSVYEALVLSHQNKRYLSFSNICHNWPLLSCFFMTPLSCFAFYLTESFFYPLCQLMLNYLLFKYWCFSGLSLVALLLSSLLSLGNQSHLPLGFSYYQHTNDLNLYFPASPYSGVWVLYSSMTYATSLLGCLESTWNSGWNTLLSVIEVRSMDSEAVWPHRILTPKLPGYLIWSKLLIFCAPVAWFI